MLVSGSVNNLKEREQKICYQNILNIQLVFALHLQALIFYVSALMRMV